MGALLKAEVLQPVLIAAGTPITCGHGHIVAVVAHDLHVNQELATDDLLWRNAKPPRAGDLFPSCAVCGAPAHRESPLGAQLSAPDGW